MHCSDDLLLLLAEGELGWLRRIPAKRHVARCWRCRVRLRELRESIGAVATLLANDVGCPEATARAKERFSQWERANWRRHWEPAAGPWRKPLPWALAAAGMAAAMLLFLPGGRREAAPPPEAAALLRQAINSEEQAKSSGAARQILVLESGPLASPLPAGKVELTSDPARRRFVWRQYDQRGKLQRGAWSPAIGRYFVLNSGLVKNARLERVSPDDLQSASDSLERRFILWLLSEPWEPVRLTGAFAEYVGRQGVRLTANHTALRQGERIVTLEASHPGSTLALVLELSAAESTAGGFHVLSLAARDSATGQSIRIRQVKRERLDERKLLASTFLPEVDRPRRAEPPPPLSATIAPAAPALSPSLAEEARLYHALFLSGALANGEIAVHSRASGLVAEGVVKDEARRSEILERISQAGITAPLMASILTEREASGLAPAAATSEPPQRVRQAEDAALPWQSAVVAHLRQSGVAESDLPARVAAFGGRLVRHSAKALSSAWALQRIDERFGATAAALLPAAEQKMMTAIRLHCLRSVLTELAALEQILTPVAGHAVAAGGEGGVFESVRRLDAEVNRLIAGDRGEASAGLDTLNWLLSLVSGASARTRGEVAALSGGFGSQ